jgi:glycosyltransferase involved in cell wall biosynthesis
MPALRESMLRKGLRRMKSTLRLEHLAARLNAENMKAPIVERLLRDVEELRPDVLLVSPQPLLDVVVSNEVVEKTGLPTVVWFMDDYYEDRYSKAKVKELWRAASARFVSSESMQEKFAETYGGECSVLLNPIRYPKPYRPPTPSPDGRLRLAYAGTINSYYVKTMRSVLEELRGLSDKMVLDVYTSDPLPADDLDDLPLRHLPVVRPAQLVETLQGYDVLLLLSSFERDWRATAETAQAGKMAEYLASGRCVLAYGPSYADNVRYLERHGIGETVTSPSPGALRQAVLSLADAPERREELGEEAYRFGQEHRDSEKTRERMWRALLEAANSGGRVANGSKR